MYVRTKANVVELRKALTGYDDKMDVMLYVDGEYKTLDYVTIVGPNDSSPAVILADDTIRKNEEDVS